MNRAQRYIQKNLHAIIINFGIVSLFAIWHGYNLYEIVLMWFTNPIYYAQGAVILAFSLFLIYKKRYEIICINRDPCLIIGLLILFVAIIISVFGKLTFTIAAEQVSIIITMFGFVVLFYGVHIARILFLPISYLLFMFPIVEGIIGSQIYFLQNITASISASILSSFGFDVFHEGLIVELPHITLEVEKACSGLNHIVSLIAIAIPLSATFKMNNLIRVVFLSSAGIIGILLNGIRVATIGVWTYFTGNLNVHGPGDFLLVPFIFVSGLIILIIFARTIEKLHNKEGKMDEKCVTETEIRKDRNEEKKIWLAMAICLIFVSIATYFEKTEHIKGSELRNIPSLLPQYLNKIQGQQIEKYSSEIADIKSDFKESKKYNNQKYSISVFTSYINKQSERNELLSPAVNKIIRKPQVDIISLKSGAFRKIALRKNEEHGKINYFVAFFYVNGKFIENRLKIKIETIKNIILNGSSSGVFILLLSEDDKIFRTAEFNNIFNELTQEISYNLNNLNVNIHRNLPKVKKLEKNT